MSNPQTALAPTGVRLAGEKYMYVRALADPPNPVVALKLKQTGACVAKSKQAIIICIYGEGMTAGNCNDACQKMMDYLVGQGY